MKNPNISPPSGKPPGSLVWNIATTREIIHHMDAQAYQNGTLGHRAKIRLRESEDFDDLMLLTELDTAGRRRGVQVCEISEALGFIRALADES